MLAPVAMLAAGGIVFALRRTEREVRRAAATVMMIWNFAARRYHRCGP